MSLLSWNCQGAGNTETVQHLRELRRKFFPDILFLMETKQKKAYVTGLKVTLGYDNLFTVEPAGLSGGLALMWKNCLDIDILSSNKRVIDLKVKMGSLSFYLSCVYGDPVRANRKAVWNYLSNIGVLRDEPWLLAGDFNEILDSSEKEGGADRHPSSYWDFRHMTENCKIKTIRSTGNILSWAGKRDLVWVKCRLDRCFGNDEWFNLFPRCQAEYMKMYASDHRPVMLQFSHETIERNRGRFYFDRRMLDKEGIEDVIRNGWLLGDDTPLMDRIFSCRRELAKWKRSSDLNSKTKIDRLHLDLEQEIIKQSPNYDRMRRLKISLSKAYRDEETFWRQRSRQLWLKAGDRNSRFFHNSVKGRKNLNRILMLLDNMDREHFSEGAKGDIALAFFRDLFTSSNPHDLDSFFTGFPERVTPEMNSVLTAEVSDTEIKNAAFGVKGSSAPGEDGLSGIFYQKFWHIVGPSVSCEVRKFFTTSTLSPGWNHTQLCLIPKITNATHMKDMRPISLCSVQYKIVARILCDRLKQVLPQIISETQGAFVAERSITDNIIIAHEMVHGLRTNDSISTDFMAVKTDMSKAFDRVEWAFLETLLERMGFARTWVAWIMSCVSTVSYSVLINGSSHGFLRPERGIRQGDPLSPFLFILCAEALVHSLNQSEADKRLTGIRIATNAPAVHHLLFADDSLLLCRATKTESTELKEILDGYEKVSGQTINYRKSSIIFGSKVPLAAKREVQEVLGINTEGGDGKYLGLPESFSGSKRKLLHFIQEKLQGRLEGWFAQSLSQGGKEVLIKSVALALPVYAMSCFRLSKDLCAKLTSALTEFWWSNGSNRHKLPWVAWKKLCKQKDSGGMGFHDIELHNQALLGKQAWRIWSFPNSLLSRLLKARYFRNSSFLGCSIGNRPSYAWRSLLHGRELLKKGLLDTVGDGSDMNVWSANWILDKLPRPPMYHPTNPITLSLKVNDLLIEHTNLWDVPLLRRTFVSEDVDRILCITARPHLRDSKKWCSSPSGLYTTQSGYRLAELINELQQPPPAPIPPIEKRLWSNLWKVKTLPKIRHFLWRALSGALAVKANLRSRGIQVSETCASCGQGSETVSHVLFTCPSALDVWRALNFPIPPAGFSPNSVFLNLHYLTEGAKRPSTDSSLRRSFPWILWHLWKARNSLLFERTKLSPETIKNMIKDDSEIWFLANQADGPTNTEAVTSSWLRPPVRSLKCNVGSSWSNDRSSCGASWILRNHNGETLMHSRRSFSMVTSSLSADLLSLHWAVESLANLKQTNVILEFSSPALCEALAHPNCYPLHAQIFESLNSLLPFLGPWCLRLAPSSENKVATEIAISVTRDSRLHSYVARNGPRWLSHLLNQEAAA